MVVGRNGSGYPWELEHVPRPRLNLEFCPTSLSRVLVTHSLQVYTKNFKKFKKKDKNLNKILLNLYKIFIIHYDIIQHNAIQIKNEIYDANLLKDN